jgi:hypothetical protein
MFGGFFLHSIALPLRTFIGGSGGGGQAKAGVWGMGMGQGLGGSQGAFFDRVCGGIFLAIKSHIVMNQTGS